MSNIERLASVYVTTARMYYAKDVIDVALEYYLKAEEIYKSTENLAQQISIQNNLAIIYARLENIEKATYYFHKAFRYHKSFKNKDSLQYASILINMGTLYLKKNIDSSLVYYQRSLEISKKLNNNMIAAYLNTNIGKAMYEKDSTAAKKAKEYYDKALDIAKKVEDKSVEALVNGYVSDFYLNEKQHD